MLSTREIYKGIFEAVLENQSLVLKVSSEMQAQKGELDDPWWKLNEHYICKVEPFLHNHDERRS